jgi:hypothetical protein
MLRETTWKHGLHIKFLCILYIHTGRDKGAPLAGSPAKPRPAAGATAAGEAGLSLLLPAGQKPRSREALSQSLKAHVLLQRKSLFLEGQLGHVYSLADNCVPKFGAKIWGGLASLEAAAAPPAGASPLYRALIMYTYIYIYY